MNYNFSEITFPSRDGIHTIHAEIYTPKNCEAKGIVQLAHGMIDHVGRYKHLAEYLTGEGYILAGNNHLGHGKSAGNSSDFGFFASKGGVDTVIRDMHTMNRYLRDSFPNLPLVIMGHSMGSFLARLYVVRYPHSIRGAVIHGTSGPNLLLPMGRTVAALVKNIKGERHRSKLIKKLAFGSYNAKFPKSEGPDAWLTRDPEELSKRSKDKYTDFIFTTSGYIDLFKMIGESNGDSWFKAYPKELPTLILSGDMDPVGNYGKGPDYVYKHLMISGCKSVEKKIYEGARHELFNEINRDEVFRDLLEWLEKIK
ncbi:MAG: alpha/beta hydrolase [Ruminococcaceae bacterium]|nr:alpha/beta hydrolase [Oscillospiraceae bacterium]